MAIGGADLGSRIDLPGPMWSEAVTSMTRSRPPTRLPCAARSLPVNSQHRSMPTRCRGSTGRPSWFPELGGRATRSGAARLALSFRDHPAFASGVPGDVRGTGVTATQFGRADRLNTKVVWGRPVTIRTSPRGIGPRWSTWGTSIHGSHGSPGASDSRRCTAASVTRLTARRLAVVNGRCRRHQADRGRARWIRLA